MDKNQAIIDFLLTCPTILSNPLFFNFANAKDKSKQIVIGAVDNSINENYVDGSVRRRYLFTIIDFCSVSYQALPKVAGLETENVADLKLVQDVLDWINEQNDLQNFPNFGEDYVIDEMKTTTDVPNLNGVDTSVTPALAKYSIGIQIDYLDMSKMLWK